ncbi:MAG: glycerol-3-phosphate responsive antiterminator [Lachnospiraceae bacterium]|nr:glycerol-3-phosphate responsive antiterminator [Lachnospiraceae bacterium]
MKKEYREAIEDSPVIAAANSFESLEKSLTCESRIIFILFGDICNIPDIVAKIKAAGKLAVVHIDLITGLAPKEIAVDFIKQRTDADGIISTKPALVKYAAKLSLFTVLRFFVIDSLALSNIEKQLQNVKPDVIEVLPALMPRVLTRICSLVHVPVITGGLIAEKEDVIAMLSAGATCVSSTSETIWFL